MTSTDESAQVRQAWQGKVALVTGSARRVGRAIALELAALGLHQVVHHSQSDAEAAEAAEMLRALGVQALIVKADLRYPAEIQAMFSAVSAHFGRLDVLVNSASNFVRKPLLETTGDDWQTILDVNLLAPFHCVQQAVPLMRASGEGGAIVNILDLSAFRAWKSFGAHSVSKAALKTLTEALALSLGPDIRVNAVAPGPVLRDEGNSPARWQQIGARLPVGHTGEPSDVARAVAFLIGQPFITGTTLRVDGGEGLL